MQIFIARNNQQLGPFDLATIQAQLNDGSLAPSDLAWYEGAAGWAPLSTVPGIVIGAPPVKPGPPPPPAVAPPPPPRSSAPAPAAIIPSPFVPAPSPVIPPAAAAPAAPKKSGFKTVASVVIGIAILGLGVLRIVNQGSRLFKNSKEKSSASISSAQPPAKPLKTVTLPVNNSRLMFQIPQDYSQEKREPGLVCEGDKNDSVICVIYREEPSGTLEELKSRAASGSEQTIRDKGGQNIRSSGVSQMRTAKGIDVLYYTVNYTEKAKPLVAIGYFCTVKKDRVAYFFGATTPKFQDAVNKDMRIAVESLEKL
ncbi:MAG: domain 2 [Verrucomicrobiota bacterium]